MIRNLRNWLLASSMLIGFAASAQNFQQTWGPATTTGALTPVISFRQFGFVPSIHTLDWYFDGTVPAACTLQAEGSPDGTHWYALQNSGDSPLDCTTPKMVVIVQRPVMFFRVNMLSYTGATDGTTRLFIHYTLGK